MNMNNGVINGPSPRQATVVTIIGYLMMFGTAFASLGIMPGLFVADDAARTAQNILANRLLFGVAIVAYLINFTGDLLAAWGLYELLKPVNASISMFVAWLRVAFAAMGLAILTNLVTAHRLLTAPVAASFLGQGERELRAQLAIASFNWQFSFSLIFFGVYLLAQGGLIYASKIMPRWLGALLMLDGAVWIVMSSGPYLWPDIHFGPLFYFTFAELLLPVWLIGWGLRRAATGGDG